MTEETLFAAALEKVAPGERAAFLAEACAGDAALRRRVEALLASHDQAGFLQTPVGRRAAAEPAAEAASQAPPAGDEAPPALDFLAPAQKPGSLGRLGHYEMLEVEGKGGMGIVLRAFDEKLHRVVAIKVMAPALATTGAARQ